MAARPEAWVCDRCLAVSAVSNAVEGMMSVCCECSVYQVEVCASSVALVHRSFTECDVS